VKIEDIKRIAVIATGEMGSQIAQILANKGGYQVVLNYAKEANIERGLTAVRNELKRFYVDKGKMTEAEVEEIVCRIEGETDIAKAVQGVDLVIEAVTENMELKRDVFDKLSRHTLPHAVLATTTSNLNISEIARITQKPDKVIGMHFFNPVSISQMIEVVKGSATSEETLEIAKELTRKLGKEPLVCGDFSYGFLANRAYTVMALECVQMLWERVATPEDIDKALMLSYGLPIGPLKLFDTLGVWRILAASEQEKMREVGPQKGHLHPMIRMMVRGGYQGGKGHPGSYEFYEDVLKKM
jgi:3-hydroxybutyryl-CoA dehydrogenase